MLTSAAQLSAVDLYRDNVSLSVSSVCMVLELGGNQNCGWSASSLSLLVVYTLPLPATMWHESVMYLSSQCLPEEPIWLLGGH